MRSDGPPTPSDDVAAADWVRERLSAPRDNVVTTIVPGGFAAYARILHPVQTPGFGAALVRWSEVSKWSGVAMNPQVQWHEIALPFVRPMAEPPWRGQGPAEGSLYGPDAEALIEHLVRATDAADTCYLCIWDGYGGGVSYAAPAPQKSELPRRRDQHASVIMPFREYVLYERPLLDATSFEIGGRRPQTPNLWWPSDRSWCVASEIDCQWTYLGGSRALIDEVLADDRIESLPASAGDPVFVEFAGWLAELIDRLIDEVTASGEASVELALGTVEVRWRPAWRRGRGQLTTRSSRTSGWSGGGTALNARDPLEFRRQLRFYVEHAVLSLVRT
jgi:hypothetical protein